MKTLLKGDVSFLCSKYSGTRVQRMTKFRPSTYLLTNHDQLTFKAMMLLAERSVDGRNFNVISHLCLRIDSLSFKPACLLGQRLIRKFVEIFTERS